MLEYKMNPQVSPADIAALRRYVGWGGMEAGQMETRQES